jgi:F-type H+-transporting ATPase subunit delta
MIVAPVAYRYARSLMELAQEKGVLAGVHEDMRLVGSTCAANRELVVLLNSPVVKADKKDRILEQVFAGKVGQLTATFMGILVRKGREASVAPCGPCVQRALQDQQEHRRCPGFQRRAL